MLRPLRRVGVTAALLVALGCADSELPLETWLLNDAQRKAFLHHYSPVILKQTNEFLTPGRDWISNFYFDEYKGEDDEDEDKDDPVFGNFANNRKNWEQRLDDYLDSAADDPEFKDWKLRPTLYTHLIEFQEGTRKSVVLLYHIYHSSQLVGVHDWERVEIRLDDLTESAGPGSGEDVAYVAITRHSCHPARSEDEVQWYETANGKHPLLWQGPWDFSLAAPTTLQKDRCNELIHSTAELRFVETKWDDLEALLESGTNARVEIEEDKLDTTFHYVFVDEADCEARATLATQALTRASGKSLASGHPWYLPMHGEDVRRIQYELQDTADIFPTHLHRPEQENPSWNGNQLRIWMDAPIGNERKTKMWNSDGSHDWGTTPLWEGSSPIVKFEKKDRDDMWPRNSKSGYPPKGWFWGVYRLDGRGNFDDQALSPGAPGESRCTRNQKPEACLESCSEGVCPYWYQHDYFAHTGEKPSILGSWSCSASTTEDQVGDWLEKDWHTSAQGGFDGRWQGLFADAVSAAACSP